MKQEIVKFYGSDLTCIVGESGQILVVVKPVCDALGLDSERAIKVLSDDEVLGPERSEQTVQVDNDRPWIFAVRQISAPCGRNIN
jgi:hypothetical protein